MVNKYTKLKLNNSRIVSLYLSGMTQVEVAEEMGLTQKIVYHCLKEEKIKCRIAAPRNQKAANNNNWKGNNVTYSAFHYRIVVLKGKPKKCEVCGTVDIKKHYDWANLSGKFNDPKDYKRMCRSCHWKYDRKHLNFLKGGDKNA